MKKAEDIEDTIPEIEDLDGYQFDARFDLDGFRLGQMESDFGMENSMQDIFG